MRIVDGNECTDGNTFYLGDGAYATVIPHGLLVWCDRGVDDYHFVYLEREAATNLSQRFVQTVQRIENARAID